MVSVIVMNPAGVTGIMEIKPWPGAEVVATTVGSTVDSMACVVCGCTGSSVGRACIGSVGTALTVEGVEDVEDAEEALG